MVALKCNKKWGIFPIFLLKHKYTLNGINIPSFTALTKLHYNEKKNDENISMAFATTQNIIK